MWERFEPPKGTKKASLSEERELYELIRDTQIEVRFSLLDLYGFLHIPFSAKEPSLIRQWLETVEAIAESHDLPEPIIKTRNLEELELSYKAIGLHLLFLYRLGKKTEAVYWERIREEISEGVHDQLKDEMLNYQRKCKRCGKSYRMTHVFIYVMLVIIEAIGRHTGCIDPLPQVVRRTTQNDVRYKCTSFCVEGWAVPNHFVSLWPIELLAALIVYPPSYHAPQKGHGSIRECRKKRENQIDQSGNRFTR